MKPILNRRLLQCFFGTILLSSCNKLPITPPFPTGKVMVTTPMSDYLNFYSGQDSLQILYQQGAVQDPTKEQSSSTGVEAGYVFRTAVAGYVFELGLRLPETGYPHMVTLWDSATQAILVQMMVTNSSSSTFTYVGLNSSNPPVMLQPNHGYEISFNSATPDSSLTDFGPSNEVYIPFGLFDVNSPIAQFYPLFPYTDGPIIIEGYCGNLYGGIPLSITPWPGGSGFECFCMNGFEGFVDIGFAHL
jgi:hypothetical protein